MSKNEIITEEEQHVVNYKFSEKELQSKAQELARALQDKDAIEDEKKEANAGFKARLEEQNLKINKLGKHVSNGTEKRSLLCQVEKDFDNGMKKIYHDGILYDEVKLTGTDHQTKIKVDVPIADVSTSQLTTDQKPQ